jgi:flagellar hook protein FlgE
MSIGVMSSAQSAIAAYSAMLDNTANNVANVNTENYKPLETSMHESSNGAVTAYTKRSEEADQVDLSKEAVDLIIAEAGVKANMNVLKTAQETEKSVIDILA